MVWSSLVGNDAVLVRFSEFYWDEKLPQLTILTAAAVVAVVAVVAAESRLLFVQFGLSNNAEPRAGKRIATCLRDCGSTFFTMH